ncbi:MAG: hypothetical protein HGA35_00345, partial [Erysipelotrichaceae bacterium]|nr:hypothetical protein [Erysipelotrichaceae bacterium]
QQPWLKEQLKERIIQHGDLLTLHFGKFKGQTLSYIYNEKKWYFDYITKPKEPKTEIEIETETETETETSSYVNHGKLTPSDYKLSGNDY